MDRAKSTQIKKILQPLTGIVFTLSFGMLFISTTMLKVLTANPYFRLIYSYLGITALIISLATLATDIYEYAQNKTREKPVRKLSWIAFRGCIILVVYYYAYLFPVYPKSDTLVLMLLLTICASNLEEKRILQTALSIGVVFVIAFFILSMLGIIENNRGNSFGFIYRTDYACHILCLALIWCMLKDGWLTWIGQLGLIALFFFLLIFVKGKVAVCCVLFLIAGTFWRYYRRSNDVPFQDRAAFGLIIPLLFRVIYFPFTVFDKFVYKGVYGKLKPITKTRLTHSARCGMAFIFPIAATLSFLFTLTYRKLILFWNKVPGLGSIKSRMILGTVGFEEFPIALFGNLIPFAGNGESEKAVNFYFFLDCGFIKILLQYGILFFLIIVGLMTFAQIRLYARKHYYSMFLLSIYAIDCIIEFEMENLSYNVFILLAACVLSARPDISISERFSIKRLTGFKRTVMACGFLCICLAFSVWCYTANQISGWRGWSPHYRACVVVPGDYIDAVKDRRLSEQRLLTAGNYMKTHSDAVCIVNGIDDRDRLVAEGIDPSRILTDDRARSIDEMLINADTMIRDEGLPERLTVCTYAMQQPLIAKCAEKIHIPVNSITMNMPRELYLKNYTVEQWKLLWKR